MRCLSSLASLEVLSLLFSWCWSVAAGISTTSNMAYTNWSECEDSCWKNHLHFSLYPSFISLHHLFLLKASACFLVTISKHLMSQATVIVIWSMNHCYLGKSWLQDLIVYERWKQTLLSQSFHWDTRNKDIYLLPFSKAKCSSNVAIFLLNERKQNLWRLTANSSVWKSQILWNWATFLKYIV